jgi:phenylacetate-coenzyme A ligase PaaK-like adenylate-forming protein
MSRLFWKAANGVFPEYRRMQRLIQRYIQLDQETAARQTRESLYQYLIYCRSYSPFWRERWPAEARDFRSEDAEHVLALLPTLDKATLREHREDLRIRPEDRKPGDGFPPIGRQKETRSGGTTGVPVAIFQDDQGDHRARATLDFFYNLCGLVPGAPFFYVWGSNNELSDLSRSWQKRASSFLRGIHPVPAFGLTPEKMSNIARQMNETRHVKSAMFFVSALETLLSWVSQTGIKLRRLDRVLTGGGLLHPELRLQAQQYLADEVFDVYGTREFGLIACETPAHDGLSIASWLNHVEVLDLEQSRQSSGKIGEVFITAFWNYSFALIRVATGDTAQLVPAATNEGLPVPKLRDLKGRIAEHLIGPGNTVIDPSAVIHMIGVLIAPPWLKKFQLRQLSTSRFELLVESWDSSVSASSVAELETSVSEGLSKLVKATIQVTVLQVDEIPTAPSGKHLYCVRSGSSRTEATYKSI